MKRIFNGLKRYGILGLIIKFIKKVTYKIFFMFDKMDNNRELKRKKKIQELNKKKNKAKYDELEKICKDKKYKYVFLFYPYTEWDLPIFQRPQQIALELSKRDDILYIFGTANCIYDHVNVYEQINENLYITTEFDFIADLELKNRVIHLYSTDIVSDLDFVKECLKRKDRVLYEYIDEIHEDITQSIPKEFFEKHNYILNNEECYVVTTADKLYDDVKKVRNNNFVLSTNGVNIEDFIVKDNIETPKVIEDIQSKHEKIIGYYGALAKWFDYKLLDKVAKKYPNYAFVLIGIEYDKSLKESKVLSNKNIYYIGKVDYKQLINYSSKFDLLTIPFLINEVTESTSPVKLFEYMCTQKPILTTAMKECKKYKSVNIANDHEEFIRKIPEVIELNKDEKYKELLLKEAKENTWTSKANSIIKLLETK